MEWMDGLNETISYIEEHLTEEIDTGTLARLACCSAYHYQRMFACLAGVPLSEYIRRRRMSRAAADLQNGERVVDVALKYGYQSPTAFNRAFQAVHGLAPSAVRSACASIKAFPPLRFILTVKGAVEMEYRIEKRDAFQVVGVSAPMEHELEKNFALVPRMWERAGTDGTIQRLAGLMEGPPAGLLGICDCQDGQEWRYYIAVASTRTGGGLETCLVPAATWAVFPGAGSAQSIQELEQRILTEWLPTSGYEYGAGPDVEVYLSADPADARYEVWIPVVKKDA